MMTRQEIGLNIKRIREQRQITREKLVKLVGDESISVSTIQRLEYGATKISLELLQKIANVLNVETKELFEKNGQRDFICELLKDLDEEPRFEEYYLDMLKLFYPDLQYDGILDWRRFPIRNLAQFIIYLPLMDKRLLSDVLWRVSGLPSGNEHYLLHELEVLYSQIPEGNAKTYADYMASKMSYEEYVKYNTYGNEENDQEIIRKEREMADISDDYLNILKEQYLSYH